MPKLRSRGDRYGMSGATGIGDDAGNVSFQPLRQHTTCQGCGAKLVRNPDSEVSDLQHWRADEDAAD
jgi:hypothetical protein